MTQDELAALKYVLAFPDADLPRQEYAWWCEENGRPERARLITLQLNRTHIVDDEVARKFLEEERRLLSKLQAALSPLDASQLRDPDEFEACFVRGFVEIVTCTARDWLASAEYLLESNPIRKVRLKTWPEVDCVNGGEGDAYWIFRELRGIPFNKVQRVRLDGAQELFAEVFAQRLSGRNDTISEQLAASLLLSSHWPSIQFVMPKTTLSRIRLIEALASELAGSKDSFRTRRQLAKMGRAAMEALEEVNRLKLETDAQIRAAAKRALERIAKTSD